MELQKKVNIVTPKWAKELLKPSRYKAIYGGRGSGKSHFFADLLIELCLMKPNTRAVCVREIQKTLSQSVKRLLEAKIETLDLGQYFTILQTKIKSKLGKGGIIFQGMQNHTAESIKSLEGYDIAWVEEAQTFSQRSMDILRPTIRKKNSELWFSWNPRFETDPVDIFFRGGSIPPKTIVKEVLYTDNPWFPDVLKDEMEYDKGRDTDKYNHIWLGDYLNISHARVFSNWTVDSFTTPEHAMFLFGADWGYAVDPTVLIRCYIAGRKLFIDQEAYRVGCDIIDTPSLFLTIPEAENWPIVADSSRPETIAHMRKHGFKKIVPSVKGKGSVQDGISFLQSYDIIVHERCKHTIDELKLYSWKTDPHTGTVLPVLADEHNHVIDALRYAVEGTRRLKQNETKGVSIKPTMNKWT